MHLLKITSTFGPMCADSVRMKLRRPLLSLLAFLGIGAYANAGTFTVSFPNFNGTTTDSSIQTLINNTYLTGTGLSVTLTGAESSTAPCPSSDCNGGTGNTANYAGDGHVISNVSTNNISYTLANKDGSTFIINNNLSSSYNYINMAFSLPAGDTITGVSFDYEVFPDINCPDTNGNDCGHNDAYLPGISLTTVGGGGGTAVWSASAVTPTSPINNSPDSNTELAPQLLGSASVTGLSTTDLDFLDWPAEIGIDNIKITVSTPPSVPEPSSVFLLGTAFLGVGLSLRRRFSKLS
jgi:hypothetical protein